MKFIQYIFPLLLLLSCGQRTTKELNDSDKIYNWFVNQQRENGLLPSIEGERLVSLYDNALAIILFSINGDFKRAEKILDYFDSRRETELNIAPGGFFQFRDVYENTTAGSNRWSGDNSWLLIAINNYHHLTNSTKYINLATDLESWLKSLQQNNGALIGGYNSDGTEIHIVTEAMIDAFNAVPYYTEFHKGILNYFESTLWNKETKLLTTWINPPKPEYKYALDMVSWGYLGLTEYPSEVLKESITKFGTNIGITGFCIDSTRNHIWLEGTGQMAVAFNYANDNSNYEFYKNELHKALITSGYESSAGLPYITNNEGAKTYGGGEFWDKADSDICISSSAWYYFAIKQYNPMETGRIKNINSNELIWLQEQ